MPAVLPLQPLKNVMDNLVTWTNRSLRQDTDEV